MKNIRTIRYLQITRKMKKKYEKVFYSFFIIILFSIIGGVVKYSLRYIDANPDLYIPKTRDIAI